ncbi:hypothetical protein AK830_g4200 [Neonectria ditissima]|uniref:Uncharacterized protein n=1 Tax=Neonectria ditissima TaxID=78410 RepID=A0A0P7AWG9_9HYPO|nr:hypothetical protein AK830_g4200 [Neonectria ditissima]
MKISSLIAAFAAATTVASMALPVPSRNLDLKDFDSARDLKNLRYAQHRQYKQDLKEFKAEQKERHYKEMQAALELKRASDIKKHERIKHAIEMRKMEERKKNEEAREAYERRKAESARKQLKLLEAYETRKAAKLYPGYETRKAAKSNPAYDPRKAAKSNPAYETRKAAKSNPAYDPRKAAKSNPAYETRKAAKSNPAYDPRRAHQLNREQDFHGAPEPEPRSRKVVGARIGRVLPTGPTGPGGDQPEMQVNVTVTIDTPEADAEDSQPTKLSPGAVIPNPGQPQPNVPDAWSGPGRVGHLGPRDKVPDSNSDDKKRKEDVECCFPIGTRGEKIKTLGDLIKDPWGGVVYLYKLINHTIID